MIKKIRIDNTNYFFDSSNLILYKDKVVKNTTLSKIFKEDDKSRLYKLVLNVSNACNLKCKYCYASCGNYGRENNFMTEETALNIIEELKNQFSSIQTVYFFGGEPTLNPKIISLLISKLNESYTIKDYRIVTNASALSNELINLFVNNNFKVYISIDGPQEINDFLRGTHYDSLMENILKLKESSIGNKLELICTYTKFHQEKISMEDLVDFYEKLGVKYSISDVITDDKTLKIKKSKKDLIVQEIDFIEKSFERLYNNSLNVGISVFVRNILEALVLKNLTTCFCKELKQGYSKVYDYNGDIYSCIRLVGQYKADNKKIEEYNSKDNQNCNKCWAKYICRDCVADVILGNNFAPYESSSCYRKKLYNYTLKKCIELYHREPEKFSVILNNFFKNYLF